jgi:predicted O-methyltransferase YrrM
MNDQEYVEYCYTHILRRPSDPEGKSHYVNALKHKRITRDDLLRSFFECDEYKSSVASVREFVPPGHFFSAIPSQQEREAYLNCDFENKPLQGIRFNDQKQCELLNQLKQYYSECPFPEIKTAKYRYYFNNQSYNYTDGLILYSMIRHFKPERIIEIGSGFSSCAMMDTNDVFRNGAIDLTFIEPYPDLLRSLMRVADKNHTLLPIRLQEANLNLFQSLQENDILFIDSTHVSKLNSDVNRIFFELLPSLKKGVLIHFHDIFWPFEYPKEWIREGRAWSEAYLLRAFLEFNDSYEIVFFTSYMHTFHGELFQKHMPLCLKNAGANMWIRRTT